MSYFIRTNITPPQVWKIESDTAALLGVANPECCPGGYFKAQPGETIWDAIKRGTPWFEPAGENPFIPTHLEPGEYYPRMARPHGHGIGLWTSWCPDAEHHTNSIALARGQLAALTRQLDRICQTIHPSNKTFDTFGHDIRNLLILACTEVESHWRAVLIANNIRKDRYNTQDYVRLRRAMRLDEYAVSFPKYPWIEAMRPFSGWGNSSCPTQDLKWYDAYNAVKHARETEFERGTLRHVFEAISGCATMMAAQFAIQLELERRPEFESFFHFSEVPTWELSEIYLPPCAGTDLAWRQRNYDFLPPYS
ncbi:hypothetical protein [Rhizomicrobium electricum]|uniref:hypothetical protein n=1 Tax=Rhizomicrobium electricum TaxID=480070 RepID=UPI001421C4F5|nr:hypothetical protein [Rhizomicrobium electricum]NIJ49473.1 hypothetical protein [Rhizomicrobium electricum]